MLTWGFSGAIWVLMAIPPIVLFYYLRRRFRGQTISSIYLWARLKLPSQGASRIKRRNAWLLILQLLVVLTAGAALARPAWFFARSNRPGILVLMDVSASMTAEEDGRSRWEQAVDWLEREIERLPSDRDLAVLLCAAGSKPLEEGGSYRRKNTVRRLRAIKPQGVRFDEERVRQDLQAWLTVQGRSWETWLVTDGGLDMGGQELNNLLKGTVKIHYVGKDLPNIGLYGLRILPGGKAEFSTYNSWTAPHSIDLRITRNQKQLTQWNLRISPGVNRYSVEWNEENLEDGLYQIEIVNPQDGYSLDDKAYFAVNPLRKVRVLLVGPIDPFLRAAFRMPGLEVTEMADWTSPKEAANSWDVIISNGRRLPIDLETHIVCFGNIQENAGVSPGTSITGALNVMNSSHPLLRYVDWENITVAKGFSLMMDQQTLPLAAIDDQPVLAVWEEKGWTRVVCGFTLGDTNLGLSGSFPIFFHNLIQQCVPQMNNPYAYTLTAGIPAGHVVSDDWKIMNPGEIRMKRMGRRVHLEALNPGGFTWREGRRQGVIAANLPVSELDLSIRRILPFSEKVHGLTGEQPRSLSLADWAIGLLIVFIVLEWIGWRGWTQRRMKGDDHGIR